MAESNSGRQMEHCFILFFKKRQKSMKISSVESNSGRQAEYYFILFFKK